jgi:hypothetical protein
MEATFRELADKAEDLWPSPWREAILDCIERRAVIGTPIASTSPANSSTGVLPSWEMPRMRRPR